MKNKVLAAILVAVALMLGGCSGTDLDQLAGEGNSDYQIQNEGAFVVRVKTVAGENFYVGVVPNDAVTTDGTNWQYPYNLVVEWGDGSAEEVISDNGFLAQHTYSGNSESVIEIYGDGNLSRITFYLGDGVAGIVDPDVMPEQNAAKVVEIISEGV